MELTDKWGEIPLSGVGGGVVGDPGNFGLVVGHEGLVPQLTCPDVEFGKR